MQAVKDGALDAFFWSGGVPTSAVTDLATSRELLLLPTDQYVGKLQERYGDFYAAAEIERRRLRGRRCPGQGRGRPQLPGGEPVDGPRAGLPAHQAAVRPARTPWSRSTRRPSALSWRPPPRSPPSSSTRGPSATTTSRPRREAGPGGRGRRPGRGGASPRPLALVAGPRARRGDPAVVVADERGREVASVPLPEVGPVRPVLPALGLPGRGDRDVRGQPAAASGWSRSPRPARPCSTTTSWRAAAVADHGWRASSRPPPRAWTALPLVATEVGRRTLVVGDRRVPLFTPGGSPAHLVLSVRRG